MHLKHKYQFPTPKDITWWFCSTFSSSLSGKHLSSAAHLPQSVNCQFIYLSAFPLQSVTVNLLENVKFENSNSTRSFGFYIRRKPTWIFILITKLINLDFNRVVTCSKANVQTMFKHINFYYLTFRFSNFSLSTSFLSLTWAFHSDTFWGFFIFN